MSSPRTPAELQKDEVFRAELRAALEQPVIQQAFASLRFYCGLYRTPRIVTPANVIHHSAVWVGGFNAALDSLESLTRVPVNPHKERESWEHITVPEDQLL